MPASDRDPQPDLVEPARGFWERVSALFDAPAADAPARRFRWRPGTAVPSSPPEPPKKEERFGDDLLIEAWRGGMAAPEPTPGGPISDWIYRTFLKRRG